MAKLDKLFQTEIKDRFIRENFARIEKYARGDVFAKGSFSFFEMDLASDTTVGYPTTVTFSHRLGFQPKDVIMLSFTPDDEVIAWDYDSFTPTTVTVWITGAVTVRAFIGRYGET